MKINRWISVLLCMLLCVNMLPTMAFAMQPTMAFAAEGNGVIYWGTTSGNGKLIIGATKDDVLNAGAEATTVKEYNTATDKVPWSNKKSSVKSVEIVSKITPTTTSEWFKSFSACNYSVPLKIPQSRERNKGTEKTLLCQFTTNDICAILKKKRW